MTIVPRFLHVMLRVGDLERSVRFYQEQFGMAEVRRSEVPEGRYTLAFMGFGGEATHTVLELTHNWDQEDGYEVGTGFGHLAISMPDVAAACERVRAAGGKVTRDAGPVKFGTTIIAFVEDPDGYKIELVQRA